jgi:hypothetical protein
MRGDFQTSFLGGQDAFVTKFSPSGSGLVYSTSLGGTGSEFAYGIAVDSSGKAYVSGLTNSTNFSTQNAFQSSFGYGAGIRLSYPAPCSISTYEPPSTPKSLP